MRLQAALQAAFPDCDDLSFDPERGIDGFVPHLSLGQWRGTAAAEAALEQVGARSVSSWGRLGARLRTTLGAGPPGVAPTW